MIRVLLVDDNPLVVKAMRKAVPWAQHHMEVVADAGNGGVAVEILKEQPIDIVFTDIKMPHMDGLELIRRVHEFLPDMVFVIISSYSDFELVRTGFQYGAADYILKFDIDNDLVTGQLLGRLETRIAHLKNGAEEDISDLLRRKIQQSETYIACCQFRLIDVELRESGRAIAISEHLFSIEGHGESFVFTYRETHLYVLCYGARECIDSIYRRLLTLLEGQTHKFHGVGVSAVLPAPDLSILPAQAREALERKFYYPAATFFFYDDGSADTGAFEENYLSLLRELEPPFSGPDSRLLDICRELLELCAQYRIPRQALLHNMRGAIGLVTEILMNRYGSRQKNGDPFEDAAECGNFLSLKEKIEAGLLALCEQFVPPGRQETFLVIDTYLRRRYTDENMKLQNLEHDLHMSGRVISRCILENTGRHFKTYLNRIRISHAKELLRHSGMRINEIARATGYHSVEHFSRLFSSEVGCSPTLYGERQEATPAR